MENPSCSPRILNRGRNGRLNGGDACCFATAALSIDPAGGQGSVSSGTADRIVTTNFAPCPMIEVAPAEEP